MLINKILEMKTHFSSRPIIIGVHIRGGDYKRWMDGKYFFHDDVYKRYIEMIQNYIENKYKQECVFIIFSNEETSFKTVKNMYVSNNDWYIDHHAMSLCDFLFGPPSTFTMWAAFMGKIPYHHIVDASGVIPPEILHSLRKQ
jgi:hypothetical protein